MPKRAGDAYSKIALPKPTGQSRPATKPERVDKTKYTLLLTPASVRQLNDLLAGAFNAVGHRVPQSDLFRAAIDVMSQDERVRDAIIERAGELSDRN